MRRGPSPAQVSQRVRDQILPILKGYAANQPLPSDAVGPFVTRLLEIFEQLETTTLRPPVQPITSRIMRMPKLSESVPSDHAALEGAASEPVTTPEAEKKSAKTLRLTPKPKAASPVEPVIETVVEIVAEAPIVPPPVEIVVPPEPALSPAERRAEIFRKLKEAADAPAASQGDAAKDQAQPAFRYPVNRFSRSS